MIIKKFMPTWQGSKASWVKKLQHHYGKDFVELFAGSGVISASLAKTTILNDIDPFIYKILSRFDELVPMEIFTEEDYFTYRSKEDWWKYSFYLLKMSFSSMFRYSSNGFNVPFNKKIKQLRVMHEYRDSLRRWKELSPTVLNGSYLDIQKELLKDKVVISDPPYENAKAGYNTSFNYHEYWNFIKSLEGTCELIIFDYIENMPIKTTHKQTLVPNGQQKKTIECMYEFKSSKYPGYSGEMLFQELYKNYTKIDKFKYQYKNKIIQLQIDYYNSERTDKLYIEEIYDVDLYIYFYTNNKTIFVYDAKELIKKNISNSIVDRDSISDIKMLENTTITKQQTKKITLDDFS